jgi:hypothetical protein
MTSIIAIAAIHMLEDFMHVAEIDNRELGWSVGILLAFVVSGLLLALMDRLGGSGGIDSSLISVAISFFMVLRSSGVAGGASLIASFCLAA